MKIEMCSVGAPFSESGPCVRLDAFWAMKVVFREKKLSQQLCFLIELQCPFKYNFRSNFYL